MNSHAFHPSQRVGIFIDTQNLYHSARSTFSAHVNYKALVASAVAGRKLMRAFAYVIRSESQEESKFFDALVELGIETRVKDLQVFYSGEKKADWDVGIAIDIVRMSEKLDAVVLVSGDGDFTEVLKYVRSRGIRAEVMAFKKTTSQTLLTETDSFTDLGSDPAKFLIPSSRGAVGRGGKSPIRMIRSVGKKPHERPPIK
ncbi:NYN domain-containing protein [Patescibacteria group bacterium]|nr:NYN domain-containing protein [Patescibacteria group bacterium]MBU1702894.1 NYN domain-containing protein [Patescibacteria group bacterium]MBU1954059.1 NYN domain-containing protein [Patescibacteria group bacterium]